MRSQCLSPVIIGFGTRRNGAAHNVIVPHGFYLDDRFHHPGIYSSGIYSLDRTGTLETHFNESKVSRGCC
jgi:hypothetical protein